MSPRKKVVSDSPRLVKALVASCDVVPEAVANPVSLDCTLTIRYAADDDRIEKAIAAYQDGTLTVNVHQYESAERIVAEVLREAKRTARDTHANDPQVEYQIAAEEQARRAAEAAKPTAWTRMREQQHEAERKSKAAELERLAKQSRAWRRNYYGTGD
jgi:hypothetical protein